VSDEGKDFQYSAPWAGYFESLNWAEIRTVMPEENDMRIEF
jgi:hypothetical protein